MERGRESEAGGGAGSGGTGSGEGGERGWAGKKMRRENQGSP